MKQKKLLTILLALVMTLSVLTACGASSNVPVEMAMPEAPMEKVEYGVAEDAIYSSTNTVSGGGTAVQTSQKLIRRVNIDAETEDLEALLPSLLEQVAKLDGYVENQEFYNGSSYSSYRYRNANLTIRIPAQNLDGFIQQVKDVSNVVSYNESQEDVTLTYVSTESRIKALETEQERLLELLSKAENMSDLLEIEARLTDVRYELERVTSQLLVLANQVDYATINLSLEQVKVYTEVEEQTVWQRISTGFKQNLQDIGENAQDFFVWVVTYSPQLVLWAAIITVAIIVLRRSFRKRKVKKAPKQEDTQA